MGSDFNKSSLGSFSLSGGIGLPLYIILTFIMDNRPDYVSKYDQQQE